MLRTSISVAAAAIGLATALCVVVLLWVSLDAVQQRQEAAERAEVRASLLGTCIVELLLMDPGERTLADVRRVCPDGVVELMLDERAR